VCCSCSTTKRVSGSCTSSEKGGMLCTWPQLALRISSGVPKSLQVLEGLKVRNVATFKHEKALARKSVGPRQVAIGQVGGQLYAWLRRRLEGNDRREAVHGGAGTGVQWVAHRSTEAGILERGWRRGCVCLHFCTPCLLLQHLQACSRQKNIAEGVAIQLRSPRNHSIFTVHSYKVC
jgi:hypothetical protein